MFFCSLLVISREWLDYWFFIFSFLVLFVRHLENMVPLLQWRLCTRAVRIRSTGPAAILCVALSRSWVGRIRSERCTIFAGRKCTVAKCVLVGARQSQFRRSRFTCHRDWRNCWSRRHSVDYPSTLNQSRMMIGISEWYFRSIDWLISLGIFRLIV